MSPIFVAVDMEKYISHHCCASIVTNKHRDHICVSTRENAAYTEIRLANGNFAFSSVNHTGTKFHEILLIVLYLGEKKLNIQ